MHPFIHVRDPLHMALFAYSDWMHALAALTLRVAGSHTSVLRHTCPWLP